MSDAGGLPDAAASSDAAAHDGTRAHQFRLGVGKTLPLVLGVMPFGLAYGIVAVQAGLTVAETLLMSLVVFAGASQFMAVVMLQAGVGTPLIVVSTLLINVRHLVMGLSLSPYLTRTDARWRGLLAFGMADETYLTTITHYREQESAHGSPWFMFGSAVTLYSIWTLTSLVGAVAGTSISDPLKWGLDFAMPATFLTMLLPQIVSTRLLAVVIVSAVSSTAAYLLVPGKWYILIAVAAATATGVLLELHAEKVA